MRLLKSDVARASASLSLQQDHACWAERELSEAQARLDVGLAGRTEQWKARAWSRKLEQLRMRNDHLALALQARCG